jgi:hypothetical protein
MTGTPGAACPLCGEPTSPSPHAGRSAVLDCANRCRVLRQPEWESARYAELLAEMRRLAIMAPPEPVEAARPSPFARMMRRFRPVQG